MNQVVLGASIPFVAAAVIFLCRRGRAGLVSLIITPFCMALAALWAIAPDLPRFFGMHDLYSKLAHDPRTDIFLWHYTIDRFEQDSPLYLLAFLTMIAALIATAWREVRRAEASAGNNPEN